MTDHLALIAAKLQHLARMREYLAYSVTQVGPLVPVVQWQALTADQHESLAAFRVRFSEFQEHLGKTMRAVSIEKEVDVERFGSVLAHMERLQVLDSTDHWKLIRELRNAPNTRKTRRGSAPSSSRCCSRFPCCSVTTQACSSSASRPMGWICPRPI